MKANVFSIYSYSYHSRYKNRVNAKNCIGKTDVLTDFTRANDCIF
jgi:hypothetical protein